MATTPVHYVKIADNIVNIETIRLFFIDSIAANTTSDLLKLKLPEYGQINEISLISDVDNLILYLFDKDGSTVSDLPIFYSDSSGSDFGSLVYKNGDSVIQPALYLFIKNPSLTDATGRIKLKITVQQR